MIALSDGVTTVNPITVTAYEAVTDSRNIMHWIIGRPDPDYSLAGDGPRRGSLAALFPDADSAEAGRAMLSQRSTFTLTDSGNPVVDMTFIREGSMRARQGPTRGSWLLDIGFQEVAT
jgi:hypothetical protein